MPQDGPPSPTNLLGVPGVPTNSTSRKEGGEISPPVLYTWQPEKTFHPVCSKGLELQWKFHIFFLCQKMGMESTISHPFFKKCWSFFFWVPGIPIRRKKKLGREESETKSDMTTLTSGTPPLQPK